MAGLRQDASAGFSFQRGRTAAAAGRSRAANRARWTYLTTQPEMELLGTVAPDANVECVENGVDFDYFSPADSTSLEPARKYIAFVGMMDYFPNVDACRWFASDVFPALRQRLPGLEFLIVGRNPAAAINRLAVSLASGSRAG